MSIRSIFMGPRAATTIELAYVNSGQTTLETTFVLPLDSKTVLSKFEAFIDDKVIGTKVTRKEQA